MLLSVKLLVSGNVQGVGFRAFACRIGKSCALTGYAKNLPNGEVEIVAEGEKEKLDEFQRRVRVNFPSGIRVEKLALISQEEMKKRSFSSFTVEY